MRPVLLLSAPLLSALLLAAHPCLAAPRTIVLDPANTRVGFRAYVLSVLPIDGQFHRFDGRLTYDRADPARCAVTVRLESASLVLPDAAITRDVLAPHFLNAAGFPWTIYRGTCDGAGIAGTLFLHGQTHRLRLALRGRGRLFIAVARIRRAAWGVTARPLLAGPVVRIRVRVRLPS